MFRSARRPLALAGLVSLTLLSTDAVAGDTYYVYKKKKSSDCEITMRDQDAYKKAKGSSWEFVGESSTRGGARKFADSAGCTST